MKRVALTCATLALAALTACGQSTTGAPTLGAQNATVQATGAARGDTSSQQYVAQLRPLNPQHNKGGVTGRATFTIEDGQFTAAVFARNLAAGLHPIHIHAADECPTAEDDANGDGYLDVLEGVPYYGPVLIPLDSDLTSQPAGNFPFLEEAGTLTYSQSVSLEALLADLSAEDPNPTDPVVKLGENEDLNLAGRTVVVHGIMQTDLPDSVGSIAGLPSFITLPVACGEIREVK